jgi:hypothetical protein
VVRSASPSTVVMRMSSFIVRLAAVAVALVAPALGAAPALASSPLVVQTSALNYAGPSCPGFGWTCTTSSNVIQTATPGGRNVFVCQADACTVTQTAVAGGNRARCLQKSASQSQSCTIVQINQSGDNVVVTRQESEPPRAGASADQSSNQAAALTQCNLTGANTAHLNQHVVHVAFDATSATVAQDQHAAMAYTIVQSGPDATYCPTLPAGPPAGPCGSTSADLLVAHQRVRQLGVGRKARAGHQNQRSDITGEIVQCSETPARWNASESEDQKLRAKSADVDQSQVGPIRCCDKQHLGQSSSTAATCTLTQRTHQDTAPVVGTSDQTEVLRILASTTGGCTATVDLVQGPRSVRQTFATSGGTIDESVSCDAADCPSRISYTGDPHRRTGRRPVLSTLVLGASGDPLAGQTVHYTLVSEAGDRTPLCDAVSNADGIATCKAPFITALPGFYTIEASFTDPATGETFTTSVPFRVRCVEGAPCPK